MKYLLIVDFDQIGLNSVRNFETYFDKILLVMGPNAQPGKECLGALGNLDPLKYSLEIAGSTAKNAADFVIASEATRLLENFDQIQIASEDKGLDALCFHLNKVKVKVYRSCSCSPSFTQLSISEVSAQRLLSQENAFQFKLSSDADPIPICSATYNYLIEQVSLSSFQDSPPRSYIALWDYLTSAAKTVSRDESFIIQTCKQVICYLSDSGIIRTEGSRIFYKKQELSL